MKLTSLLLMVFCLHLSGATRSQTISIDARNLPLSDVLRTIKKQTDLAVVYNDRFVNPNRKVSIQVENAPLTSALESLLSPLSLTYHITESTIVIVAFESENIPLAEVAKSLEPTIQERVVSGRVTDEGGNPLEGVTVMLKGTSTVATTDAAGEYRITISDSERVLVFTTVGYGGVERTVTDQSVVDVVLTFSISDLEEVVVVGYGTQKKRDLTGAISSVKLDDTPVGTITTISHALAGKAAGLQVTQNSAQVGGGSTFRIRGETSTGAGNAPLVIIDGFPVNNTTNLGSGHRYQAGIFDNVLETINPQDIESIEILKDASSTAIYGARAGHGVILVTTKRGKEGQVRVNYAGNMSIQNMKNGYKMLDGAEFMRQRNLDLYELYLKNNGLDVYADYITMPPGHVAPEFIPRYSEAQIAEANNTDWFSEITRTGSLQTHNLSMQGGTTSTKYLASMNYTDHEGVIKNNNMQRFTAKVNLDQKISEYVKSGLTLNLSRNRYDNVPLGSGQWENAGIINSAVRFNPTIPVYNTDGTYAVNPELSQVPNPVSLLEITDNMTKDRILGSAFIEVEPISGLLLRANLGLDRRYAKRKSYLPTTTMYGEAVNGQASANQADNIDYLMDLTATYSKEVNDHSFTALVGYSFQQFNYEGMYAANSDFLTDAFLYNNLGAGAYARPDVSSAASKSALGSYFARLNYSFLGRYLMTATVRADGASNFDPDYRWGYFPSISLGWRFSEEDFMGGLSSLLSNGKIRASYGQTGNSNIGNRVFDYYQTGMRNVFGNSGHLGVFLSQLGNPRLTWETTREFNLGLDLGFLNNRINGTIEYYERTISDLLDPSKRIPSYNEISTIAANIGKTAGRGFEFTLNTANIRRESVEWTTDLTFSIYRDRWKERDPNWVPSSYQSATDPIRARFSYIAGELLQAGEAAPAHQQSLLPGQPKLIDQNGDGKLDHLDMVYIGTSDPAFYYGFNNTFQYGKFDFNIYLYGEVGRVRGASYYDAWSSGTLQNAINVSEGSLSTWRHDNQDTQTPNPLGSDYGWGNYYDKKTSYLRCRNITLGYTFASLINTLNSFRVYADVNNPFVITNWTGVDPETDGNEYAYPNVRSINFGVNISF